MTKLKRISSFIYINNSAKPLKTHRCNTNRDKSHTHLGVDVMYSLLCVATIASTLHHTQHTLTWPHVHIYIGTCVIYLFFLFINKRAHTMSEFKCTKATDSFLMHNWKIFRCSQPIFFVLFHAKIYEIVNDKNENLHENKNLTFLIACKSVEISLWV